MFEIGLKPSSRIKVKSLSCTESGNANTVSNLFHIIIILVTISISIEPLIHSCNDFHRNVYFACIVMSNSCTKFINVQGCSHHFLLPVVINGIVVRLSLPNMTKTLMIHGWLALGCGGG